MVNEYGLKNMKELWQVQSKISNIRRNIRLLLAGTSKQAGNESDIVNKLVKQGIANQGATLDDLLDLQEKQFLERRLQSVVFRKGLAKSIKQARQLVVHGFISIDGKKIDKPGFLVDANKEQNITYYKKIDLNAAPKIEITKQEKEVIKEIKEKQEADKI